MCNPENRTIFADKTRYIYTPHLKDMAKAKNLIAAAALGLGLCFPNAMTAGNINIIPTPMEMTEGTGVFRIDNNTRIASKGKEASTVPNCLPQNSNAHPR